MFRSGAIRSARSLRQPALLSAALKTRQLADMNIRRRLTTQTLPSVCPSCSRRLQSYLPACQSCGYISLIPPQTTYHALFGLPYDPNPFIIDTSALRQEFRKAQAVCHPDTWASKGSDKQDVAHNLSSSVNEAYQGLLRPLKRVEYVLSRQGHALSEEDKVDDFEFIEEVIGIMESLEELGSGDTERVREIEKINDENVKNVLDEIEGLVGQGQWAGAKSAAARLRYYDKIGKAIGRWVEVSAH